jgi:hypothetical protein
MTTNRREFVASAGTLVLANSAAPAQQDQQVLKAGVTGVGWHGMVDAKAAWTVGGVEMAAVSDIDRQHLRSAADELARLQGKRLLICSKASTARHGSILTTDNDHDHSVRDLRS